MYKRLLFFILFVLILPDLFGQDKLFLVIHPKENGYSNNRSYSDTLSVQSEINSYIQSLHSKGFLLASADSIIKTGDTVNAYIDKGSIFKWTRLKPVNMDNNLLNRSGFSEKIYSGKPFNYKQFSTLEQRIIRISENKGHPFAMVKLDSITIQNDLLDGVLTYVPGPDISFDSIEIIGNSKIKSRYLQKYLGIQPGREFQQRKIDFLSGELSKLPFIEQERPQTVIFRDNKARVVLFLKPRKANYIDGVIGILPNEGKSDKVLFTGEANLLLHNLFGSGKQIRGEWKRFNEESQLLDLHYFHPVLFGSTLNLGLDFNLLKQDSTFLNLERTIKISLPFHGYGQMFIFSTLKSSRNLLSENINNRDQSDFRYVQYGLGYEFENLDNIFLPKSGWNLNVSAGIGNKSLKNQSESINEPYAVNSVQYTALLKVEKFNKIAPRSTLLGRIQGALVGNNKNTIFPSDLYRVGGLRSLRGFNEKSFYAEHFAVATAEFRYFLEESTFVLLFIDQGYLRNSLHPVFAEDSPTGFGAGFSFATAAGIFNFVYSLGNSRSNPLAFNLSKIHFGFSSKF